MSVLCHISLMAPVSIVRENTLSLVAYESLMNMVADVIVKIGSRGKGAHGLADGWNPGYGGSRVMFVNSTIITGNIIILLFERLHL